ncbi:MAG: hypothetical protein AAB156_01920 [Pseudomonadota bacterium]
MIDPWLLLKSISAGIAVAAPVGPMSLLCMQRTLGGGRAPDVQIEKPPLLRVPLECGDTH